MNLLVFSCLLNTRNFIYKTVQRIHTKQLRAHQTQKRRTPKTICSINLCTHMVGCPRFRGSCSSQNTPTFTLNGQCKKLNIDIHIVTMETGPYKQHILLRLFAATAVNASNKQILKFKMLTHGSGGLKC